MTRRRGHILYIAEYKCGCTDEKRVKRELLNYCAKHGDDRRRIYPVPVHGEYPAARPAPGGDDR